MISFLQRAAVVIALGALVYYGWQYYVTHHAPKPEEVFPIPQETYDALAAAVSGGLVSGVGGSSMAENDLAALRQRLLVEQALATGAKREMFDAALSVTDILDKALFEKSQAQRLLSDRMSNPSRDLNGKIDEGAQDIFIASQKSRWAQRSGQLTAQIATAFAKYKALEAQVIPQK